jgi:molybdenum cofactor cytidylyltransferase
MARAASLCGVILAAGESSRMGTDKALLPWPPGETQQTFLSAAIRALSDFNDMVVVVVGNNESALAPLVYANGASLVRNPAPERGQFSSLQIGLKQVLDYGRDAAMITLVDRPPAASATLRALCAAFNSAPDETWAVVPEYGGKHGHPLLADRAMIEAFLRAPATATARDIEHQNQQHIQYLPVSDPLVAVNVNTPQDYEALSGSRK